LIESDFASGEAKAVFFLYVNNILVREGKWRPAGYVLPVIFVCLFNPAQLNNVACASDVIQLSPAAGNLYFLSKERVAVV
jgi:hypothetical protein